MGKYLLYDLFEGNYRISQHYGANPAYYQSISGGKLRSHEGVDWATPVGVKLLCPFEKGIVLRASFSAKDYGYYTVIWDPKQRCGVWYGHLSRIIAGYGAQVRKGQIVGHTGRSGNVSGPHLHVNFVETDAYGNRLNMNNGNQGFLNILDPKLVSWRLSR
jgi:murein DD-endopeptidase MepM/ murein hydrolase activator NlpD